MLIIALIILIAGIIIRYLAALQVLDIDPDIGVWMTLIACIFAVIGDLIVQIENRQVIETLKRISDKLSDSGGITD